MITLLCKNISFYSSLDKEFFFKRVDDISSIKQVEVKNKDILFHLKSKRISYDSLTKIVSLFERYKVNRDQLAVFVNDTNRDWMIYHIKGVCRSRKGKIRFAPAYGLTKYLNKIAALKIREGLQAAQSVI